MKFSRKKPLKINFISEENKRVKEIHKDAYEKIKFYKGIIKKDPKMGEKLKEELVYEIQRYRGRVKFNKSSVRKLHMSYKNAELIIPVSSSKSIKPEQFELYKKKLKRVLKEKRRISRNKHRDIREVEGVSYELSGGVHKKKNTMNDLFYKIAMKRVNSPRKPGASENHVGMEFEFFSAYSRDDVCQRLIKAGLSKNARIMTDSSIRPTEEKPLGLELCLVAAEGEVGSVMKKACDVLEEVGAEINDSCGFHVHLDSRNRDKQLLFYNLVKCQSIFFNMTYKNRSDNRFCLKQPSAEWTESSSSHYSAINREAYNKHKTIEVRTHHGTLNFEEAINWVNFLVKIANYNERLGEVKTLKNLTSNLKLDRDLFNHLKDKINLFSA